jgi:hypothetical protein
LKGWLNGNSFTAVTGHVKNMSVCADRKTKLDEINIRPFEENQYIHTKEQGNKEDH